MNIDMNIVCPNCGMDNACFNGAFIDCPDCDFEWPDDLITEDDEDDDY